MLVNEGEGRPSRRWHVADDNKATALCGAKPSRRRGWNFVLPRETTDMEEEICKPCLKWERDAILATQSLSPRLARVAMPLIRSVPWRATTHVAPHEYVVYAWSDDCRQLGEIVRGLIREHGYAKKFGQWRYRYVNIGPHRYWSFMTVLNRAPREQDFIE